MTRNVSTPSDFLRLSEETALLGLRTMNEAAEDQRAKAWPRPSGGTDWESWQPSEECEIYDRIADLLRLALRLGFEVEECITGARRQLSFPDNFAVVDEDGIVAIASSDEIDIRRFVESRRDSGVDYRIATEDRHYRAGERLASDQVGGVA
jgi:hypothetical protein